MELAYTPEQEALRKELRAYFADLMTPEVEAEVAAGETGGPACLEAVRKMGRDGWLGVGWPTEYGGRGFGTDVEQFIFMNESWRAGAPIPFLVDQHRRPDDHGVRHRGAEGLLPPEDPRRRAALLDRLHRARRRHRPRLAHHQGRQGRRRVGDQRPEDLHVAGQLRRLHLAGRPHRPRRPQAQGHHDVPGAHHRPRVLVLEDLHDGERQHLQHVLRRRAGGRRRHHRRAQPAAGTSSSTSSTTSGCRSAPPGMVERIYEEVLAWAQDDQARPTAAGSIDQEWVQLNLARVRARLEFLKLINWKVARRSGGTNPADASATKVFGTEFFTEAYRLLDGDPRPGRATSTASRPAPCWPAGIERAFQGCADPHLRRRRQRDPARPDRHVRPRHAPRARGC